MSAIPPHRARVDLSDTALRRMLRRIAPFVPAPALPIATHGRLMEESERRLEHAAHSGIAAEELVANRILESPRDFQRWEDEHAALMRRVAVEQRNRAQKVALLSASLALVHRKALFEYLRQRQIRGGERQRLLAQFHGGSDYASSVVAEHGNYLRSSASYMCSQHVGRRVMLDGLFGQPLARYEEAYAQYFGAFCDVTLARSEDDAAAHQRSLLGLLKQEVNVLRRQLLDAAQTRSDVARKPLSKEFTNRATGTQ